MTEHGSSDEPIEYGASGRQRDREAMIAEFHRAARLHFGDDDYDAREVSQDGNNATDDGTLNLRWRFTRPGEQ